MHSSLARDQGHAGGMMLRNDTGDAAMLKSGFSINFQASSREYANPYCEHQDSAPETTLLSTCAYLYCLACVRRVT